MTDVQDQVEDEVDEDVPAAAPAIHAVSAQAPDGEAELGHDVNAAGAEGADGDGAVGWVRAADRSQPSRKERDAWIIRVGQRLCGGGRFG